MAEILWRRMCALRRYLARDNLAGARTHKVAFIIQAYANAGHTSTDSKPAHLANYTPAPPPGNAQRTKWMKEHTTGNPPIKGPIGLLIQSLRIGSHGDFFINDMTIHKHDEPLIHLPTVLINHIRPLANIMTALARTKAMADTRQETTGLRKIETRSTNSAHKQAWGHHRKHTTKTDGTTTNNADDVTNPTTNGDQSNGQ